MPRDNQEWLQSIADSAEYIAELTDGISFAGYAHDRKTRAAVERHFIVIGEALSQLERQAPAIAAGIAGRGEIIGMRTTLTHRFYAENAQVVWDAIINDLPRLRAEVRLLLSSAAAEP